MDLSIKKISYYLLVIIFSLFSFTTLTYDFYPIINRVLGIVIVLLIAMTYIFTLKKRDLLILVAVIFIGIVGVFDNYNDSYNDAMYFVITLILIWKLSDNEFMNDFVDSLHKLNKFILLIAILNTAIIFVGLFIDYCYETVWYDRYFVLFAYSPHPLSCSICITLILILFSSEKFKHDIIVIALFSILTFAIFQTGARTYVVSALVLWLYLYRYKIKNRNLKYLIFFLMIFAFIFLLINSNFTQKNDYVSNDIYTSSDSLVSFSSGRFEFWMIDIKQYLKYDFVKKIFGSGFGSIYDINESIYGRRIWGHNDFINTLVCNGIFGLIIYLYIFFISLIKIYKKNKYDFLLILLYVVFTAFFNGVFKYQHYVYSIVFLYSLMYVKNYQLSYGIDNELLDYDKNSISLKNYDVKQEKKYD